MSTLSSPLSPPNYHFGYDDSQFPKMDRKARGVFRSLLYTIPELASRIGVKNDRQLILYMGANPLSLAWASSLDEGRIVCLPYGHLILPCDIPTKYLDHNGKVLSPKQMSKQMREELFYWAQNFVGIDKPLPFDERADKLLCCFIVMWRSPNIANIRKFIIGHELSHLKHDDCPSHHEKILSWKNGSIFLFFCLLGGLSILGIHYDNLNSHYYWGSGGLFILAIAIPGIRINRQLTHCQNIEFRCDRESVTTFPETREDAIRFFEEIDQFQNGFWYKLTHSSSSRRAQALRNLV